MSWWSFALGSVVTLVIVSALVWLLGREESTLARRLHLLSEKLEAVSRSSAHPEDLVSQPIFKEAVRLLSEKEVTFDSLMEYARGDNAVLSCAAFVVLRDDERERELDLAPIFACLSELNAWAYYFALGVIDRYSPTETATLGRVVLNIGDSFEYGRHYTRFFKEYIERRAAGGEALDLSDLHNAGSDTPSLDSEQRESIEALIGRLEPVHRDALRKAFNQWVHRRVDRELLRAVGQVWEPVAPSAAPVPHPRFTANLETACEALRDRRSVVLVGESGVGKTSLARAIAERFIEEDWVFFEAGYSELVAGQMYVGQFENRLRSLLQQLRNARVVWYVPDLGALRGAGRHQFNTFDALDAILPEIEGRDVVLLGEILPTPFERLAEEKPRLRRTIERVQVEPLPSDEALALAVRWAERRCSGTEKDVVSEAVQLSEQYLSSRASPGNVLQLLSHTADRKDEDSGDGTSHRAISVDDLILCLEHLTGLPSRILDERKGLDLEALRSRFESRILGQPEAVSAIVERVAMIKAGVTDPDGPLGVFLFVGPTGTGKTEVAKELVRYLFGTEKRLIRLDMSELQSPDSIGRILGEPGETGSVSLTDAVRTQPFSVILLDEFEKASPRVWDLFLQVFDDGRLTDRRGLTTDFRNTILILTSNLGASIPAGSQLGFGETEDRFRAGDVLRATGKAFRPEFLNRLDRVIVFRPLSRATMKLILEKELRLVFERRGLRRRQWAVEWDSSAIEFLLEKGFTPDLGARPLKRAIEKYLLTPLSLAIVDQTVPSGDQFLFVRSRGERLAVEFVDPDAPEPTAEDTEQLDVKSGVTLASLVLSPRTDGAALDVLSRRYSALSERLDSPLWQEQKQLALERFSDPRFWQSPERFDLLAAAERRDRIDAAMRTAKSLYERLERRRESLHRPSIARLARQLFLLEVAVDDLDQGRQWESLLRVEAPVDASESVLRCARTLSSMYRGWAEARSMRLVALEERSRSPAYRTTWFVSGFGAASLLSNEEGLHLFEVPKGPREFDRHRVTVRVKELEGEIPEPERLEHLVDELLAGEAGEARIVRRYRREPSPLVRDSVGGWRTGKLDLLLQGNFDLFPRLEESGA